MITTSEYTNLDEAYDLFNAELFAGWLPAVLITFQHKRGAAGYFSPAQFHARRGNEQVDELALNPTCFDWPDIEILQTLVHEMAHVWQQHFGQPSRGGYHNKEWAAKMIEIGLMPSDTHQPGGKTTGQNMGDYVIKGGRFDQVANRLLQQGFTVKWMSREAALVASAGGAEGEGAQEDNPKNKVKYSCPLCGANAWGKPALKLLCGDCSEPENLVELVGQ